MFAMRPTTLAIIAVAITVATGGCTDEQAEEMASTYYTERLVESLRGWLRSKAYGDWYEPYADAAARACIAEHMPLESLYGLSRSDADERIENTTPVLMSCVLEEVSRRFSQDVIERHEASLQPTVDPEASSADADAPSASTAPKRRR